MNSDINIGKKRLTVFIEGAGSEFVQGIIKKEELDAFKSSGLSWQDYCVQELGLDGYWDVNNISHLTGITVDNAQLSMMIDDKEIWSGDYRSIFKENDDILLKKIELCVKNNFEIFLCIGEDLESRNSNKEFSVIEDQLNNTIFNLNDINPKKLIIAYEPVWAIGTGLSANPSQAQEMHNFIREKFKVKFSESISDNLTIIYGGSVKPETAKDIFDQPDVDGGLIGGASLNHNDFIKIVKSIT